VCSIRVFAKNLGDPYYEPTIVVHDKGQIWFLTVLSMCALVHYTTYMYIRCHLLKLWPITVVQWESPHRIFFTLSDISSHKMITKIDIKKISSHLA